jgi:hypothetical protein
VVDVLIVYEYSNLKLAEATVGRGLGGRKRTGRDEPIGSYGTTQGISLYSYLFSYYILCIFFYKIIEQEGGTGSAWRWCVGGVALRGGER